MKIERSRARAASTDYTRRVETPAPVSVAASVFGIPDNEFTPSVRDAVMSQMGELELLRRELEFTRAALDDMKEIADRDQLLPILNRRAFVRELTRYISFAVRYGTPASLVYFDLDGFKQINDTFGHVAGDAVLEHFTQALLTNVRDSDVVGRLGGDEFGIILTHAHEAQANAKAATLAQVLGGKPLAWQGKAIPIGFSFGAFELSASDSANIAIARADEAMYAHKRAANAKR